MASSCARSCVHACEWVVGAERKEGKESRSHRIAPYLGVEVRELGLRLQHHARHEVVPRLVAQVREAVQQVRQLLGWVCVSLMMVVAAVGGVRGHEGLEPSTTDTDKTGVRVHPHGPAR